VARGRNKNKKNQPVPASPANEAQQGQIQQALIQRMSATITSGPLPAPEVLADYDAVVPGAAKIIISQFTKQSDHRMGLESTALKWEIIRANAGLIMGGIVALAFLGVAAFLIYNDHDWAGAALGTVDLASIAAIFVIGTSGQREERKARLAMLTGTGEANRRDRRR
jgi:uncharacterized membrane protein